MGKQPPLFDSPKPRARKRRGTRAPDTLTPPELKQIQEWAELTVPWLRREALDSFESVESYVEEILDYWRGDGGVKADWVATIRNRIRTKERGRLARLAKDGSGSAAKALRDPEAWAASYDARRKAIASVDVAIGPDQPISPPGGRVISIQSRRRP